MDVNLTVPETKRLPSNSFNFDSEIFKDVNSEMVHSESARSTELQTQEKHLSQVLQLASESCGLSIVTSSDKGTYLSDDSKSFIILDDDSTQVNSPSSEKYNLSFEDSDKKVSYADTVLFPLSVTDIGPTLDELAVKLLPEQALSYATKLPLGWQRTSRMSDLTSKIVDLSGFSNFKLTYKSMLGKLCIGFDSLAELAIPTSDHISGTKNAIRFLGAYGAQLSAMSQAFIDIVNGVNDVNRACCLIKDHYTNIEARLTPSIERASCVKESSEQYTKKFEALLRFHQLFLEYRFSGRSRKRAVILACFKERLLRDYSFLKPLNYIEGTEIEEVNIIGDEVLKSARQFYNESQDILQTWSHIRPSVRRIGIFHHGLTEAQADLTIDYSNRLIHLCRRMRTFQQGVVTRFYFSAETELLKALLYYDKNRLCIQLSETIKFDPLFRETCGVLSTVSNDQHVNEMLQWLHA